MAEDLTTDFTEKVTMVEDGSTAAATTDPPPASSSSSSGKGGGGTMTKEGLQGRRANASSGPKISKGFKLGGDCYQQRTTNPSWLQDRLRVYETIADRRAREWATKKPVDITVTLPDGKVMTQDKEGRNLQAWRTTPYDVAVIISQGLADAVTVARITYQDYVPDYSLAEDGMEGEDTMLDAMADTVDDGATGAGTNTVLWDMTRPLVGNVTKLELLKFEDDPEAKTVFWHSSAHMLGEALEHLYGCKLTIGPPLKGGFYYDSFMGSETLREDDCKYR